MTDVMLLSASCSVQALPHPTGVFFCLNPGQLISFKWTLPYHCDYTTTAKYYCAFTVVLRAEHFVRSSDEMQQCRTWRFAIDVTLALCHLSPEAHLYWFAANNLIRLFSCIFYSLLLNKFNFLHLIIHFVYLLFCVKWIL